MQGAAAEDQIVPADTCSIGRHELDEPADTAEHRPARTTLPMTVRVFVPGTATNTMVPQNRNFWIQAQALPEVSAGRGIGLFNSQLSVTLRHRRTGKGRVRTGKARPVVERALIPRLYWTRPRVSAGQTGAPPGTRTPNPRIKSLSGASSTEFISVRAAG